MSDYREPPIWIDRLLGLILREELLEEILGDLFEYYQRYNGKARAVANFYYFYHVLHFLRPFAIKSFGQNSNTYTMLKFNLTIAWRNLLSQRFYASLNILGLAIGISGAIFIALFILDELSFDQHFKNSDRIYRVASEIQYGDNYFHMALSPDPMAEAFKNEFPEIENSGRLRNIDPRIIKRDDESVVLDRSFFADQGFLDVFQFDAIAGNISNALTEPGQLVITETAALKLFNSTDVIGKVVESAYGSSYKISAVIPDVPDNSHFHFEALLSMEGDESRNGVWISNNYYTYFSLVEGVDYKTLEAKFESVFPKYVGPQLKRMVGLSYEEMLEQNSYMNYYLQPITSIHLNSNLDLEVESNASMNNIYIFGAVGIFLIIIAAINFMNIATARANTRAKEVGVKKVLGSIKGQLVNQFLIESLLQAFISGVIAVIIVYALLPAFNQFTDKSIIEPFFGTSNLWLYTFISIVIIGLLAGIYPAFYLSSFRPINILKGSVTTGKQKSRFRNVLVVFQFSISLVLIIGTIVVYQQLNFIQNKNLGFDRNQVILLENNSGNRSLESLKSELLSLPSVQSLSATSFIPAGGARSDSPFFIDEEGIRDNIVSLQFWSADEQYFETFGMELLEGRSFDPTRKSDSIAVVLNETAVKRLGVTDPIGKTLKIFGEFSFNGLNEFKIIGVVKDFNYATLKEEVRPLGLWMGPYTPDYFALRTSSTDYLSLIDKIEEVWKSFDAYAPFNIQFLDQKFDAQYRAELKLGKIFTLFAMLAIFIACLGLFGLSAYTAEQRRKELGIRKVLGATSGNLMLVLVGNFTKLLIVSILIAVPLAWYAMTNWLNGFAYRISLGIGVFILGSLIALLIAWITVSFQSFKAARSNPSENLKYE